MKRIILSVAIICASVYSMVLHGQTSEKDNLKKIVAEMNAEMPMALGSLGTIESASLTGDSLIYHINCDFFETYTNGNTIPEIKDLSEKIKLGFISMAQVNADFGAFLNYMSENGIWFMGDMTIGSKSTKFVISPDEQREILNSEPDFKRYVAANIAQTKEALPIDMGTMKMTEYYLEGDNIVVTMEIDESQLSMANLKNRQAAIREEILDVIKSGIEPATTSEMMNCAMAGYNMVYKYVGNVSKDEVSITLTPFEILSSINQ